MKTFIIPGDLVHLSRIRDYLNDDICGILVHQKIHASAVATAEARFAGMTEKVFTLNSLMEVNSQGPHEQDRRLYEKCLNGILSDPRVHYLATRSQFNSAFNNAILIEKVVVNSLRIIRTTKPTRLISSSTPHSLQAWIFAKCFETLHLPVYILERTPINDRAWVYRGLDMQEVVARKVVSADAQLGESALKLIREQRESKAGARDAKGFYISRMDMNSVRGAKENAWWSWMRELRILFSGKPRAFPIRVLSLLLKNRLYKSYRNLAVRELPSGPFVIYFMHYQPERSSLPEGLFHVQQWNAIRLLSWILPEGWNLLVREHPTTWLQPLDISARTATLFDDVARLRNTYLCPMDVDTFELIDKCTAVATLTGSVGFQAILRNKPVIAFGVPAYKEHPACFSIRSATDLERAFQTIEGKGLRASLSDEVLHRYLAWVEANSISADPKETDWLEARLKNFTHIYRELLCGHLHLQA